MTTADDALADTLMHFLRKAADQQKRAFEPTPGGELMPPPPEMMPQEAMPPGAMPGGPGMDPAMMAPGGAAPMDPGVIPPGAPAGPGAPPGGLHPEELQLFEEIMRQVLPGLLEEYGVKMKPKEPEDANAAVLQRMDALEQQIAQLSGTLEAVMGPPPGTPGAHPPMPMEQPGAPMGPAAVPAGAQPAPEMGMPGDITPGGGVPKLAGVLKRLRER